MEKIKLNFFGEEAEINLSEELSSLRAQISKEYMLSPSDVAEIIIYYLKEDQKKYIINSNDYKTFLKEKIPTLFLDIDQNSKIYLDFENKLKKNQNKEDEKILEELISKRKEINEKKEKKTKKYKEETDAINKQITELTSKKNLIEASYSKEMNQVNEEIKENNEKILELQKRLGLIKETGKESTQINEGNQKDTIPIFNKVNEILEKNIEKTKEIVINCQNQPNDDKSKKEKEIKQIKEITKETVKEINDLTKLVVSQSNELIQKYQNEDNLKLKGGKPNTLIVTEEDKEKSKDVIHYRVSCDGCGGKRNKNIKGIRYKCKVCKDFDFCQKCYDEKKNEHGHEFRPILVSQFPQYVERNSMKYMQRGTIHHGIKCDICGMGSIHGYRYKCAVCDEFNFCEDCEEKHGPKHGHPLIKITWSRMKDKFDENYLKLNSYESLNNNNNQ